jgi:hypothetical protein
MIRAIPGPSWSWLTCVREQYFRGGPRQREMKVSQHGVQVYKGDKVGQSSRTSSEDCVTISNIALVLEELVTNIVYPVRAAPGLSDVSPASSVLQRRASSPCTLPSNRQACTVWHRRSLGHRASRGQGRSGYRCVVSAEVSGKTERGRPLTDYHHDSA